MSRARARQGPRWQGRAQSLWPPHGRYAPVARQSREPSRLQAQPISRLPSPSFERQGSHAVSSRVSPRPEAPQQRRPESHRMLRYVRLAKKVRSARKTGPGSCDRDLAPGSFRRLSESAGAAQTPTGRRSPAYPASTPGAPAVSSVGREQKPSRMPTEPFSAIGHICVCATLRPTRRATSAAGTRSRLPVDSL